VSPDQLEALGLTCAALGLVLVALAAFIVSVVAGLLVAGFLLTAVGVTVTHLANRSAVQGGDS
jgi:uncharacterized membrane protein